MGGRKAAQEEPGTRIADDSGAGPQVIIHDPPPNLGEPQSVRDEYDRRNGWLR